MPKRWFEGDQAIRVALKRLLGRKERLGGVEKVYINLCKGLDKLGVPYVKNLPFEHLQPGDVPVVLGLGRASLEGYKKPNPIIAGIALMTHPSEWPDLLKEYPVKVYLQHSAWAMNIYKKYYGESCDIWPVGIDTDQWQPDDKQEKDVDVLIYNKIRFDKETQTRMLLDPIVSNLQSRSLRTATLNYGHYAPEEFVDLLRRARSMVFICEHESQGIAYQEALSMNVPILAWDNGKCLDTNRFAWNDPDIDASSVPYFDDRCGMTFRDIGNFYHSFDEFWQKVNAGRFRPREYMLENLTLERSAAQMLEIVKKWAK